MDAQTARTRLEELRVELRAERISYSELAELQGLADYIEPGDVELLEAAGVPEHCPDDARTRLDDCDKFRCNAQGFCDCDRT